MTKLVRIENADLSAYGVVVQVYDRGIGGEPDKLVQEISLDHPTFMANLHIHSSRYIVITEKPLSPTTV